jgi:hypothetical protein
MNDRELLERAAKAEGRVLPSTWSWGLSKGGATYWDPLEDDGQALRLAVSADIEVAICRKEGASWARWYRDGDSDPIINIRCKHAGDANVATRRAIVRAAAEIGRSIK